jgi:hypothetical protein
MVKSILPDWDKYWENFKDLNLLRQKSNNLDETLMMIEKEFAAKLMSGDHMQIVASLEERIEVLERVVRAEKHVIQTDLFEGLS